MLVLKFYLENYDRQRHYLYQRQIHDIYNSLTPALHNDPLAPVLHGIVRFLLIYTEFIQTCREMTFGPKCVHDHLDVVWCDCAVAVPVLILLYL